MNVLNVHIVHILLLQLDLKMVNLSQRKDTIIAWRFDIFARLVGYM